MVCGNEKQPCLEIKPLSLEPESCLLKGASLSQKKYFFFNRDAEKSSAWLLGTASAEYLSPGNYDFLVAFGILC